VEKVAGISIVSILSCQFDVVVVVDEAEGGVTYLAVADPYFFAGA